jgi:phosphoribosyl 1,2-cyclic phosphodiesterase
MRAWSLGSGSHGNAILLECDGTRLLVDAGFPPRELARRLSTLAVAPESIAGVIVTHEHVDHVRGVASAQRRWRWQVFGSAGTLARIRRLDHARSSAVLPGTGWSVGALTVELLSVSHDAASPVAVLATSQRSGFRTGIAHDLGTVSDALRRAFSRLDLLLLESNHDEGMLRAGPYPPFLQDRIAGRHGHLSNRQSAVFARDLAGRTLRELVLLHLSEVNNTPRQAVAAARHALHGARSECTVAASSQHVVVGPFGDGRFAARQLTLAL